jgi:hypothetical protein
MDFDYYTGSRVVDWKCIDGGAELIPSSMNAKLKKPLTEKDLKKRVTKIAIDRKDSSEFPMKV